MPVDSPGGPIFEEVLRGCRPRSGLPLSAWVCELLPAAETPGRTNREQAFPAKENISTVPHVNQGFTQNIHARHVLDLVDIGQSAAVFFDADPDFQILTALPLFRPCFASGPKLDLPHLRKGMVHT